MPRPLKSCSSAPLAPALIPPRPLAQPFLEAQKGQWGRGVRQRTGYAANVLRVSAAIGAGGLGFSSSALSTQLPSAWPTAPRVFVSTSRSSRPKKVGFDGSGVSPALGGFWESSSFCCAGCAWGVGWSGQGQAPTSPALIRQRMLNCTSGFEFCRLQCRAP